MPIFQAWSGEVLGRLEPKSMQELEDAVIQWFPEAAEPLFRYFNLDKASTTIYTWVQLLSAKTVTIVSVPKDLWTNFQHAVHLLPKQHLDLFVLLHGSLQTLGLFEQLGAHLVYVEHTDDFLWQTCVPDWSRPVESHCLGPLDTFLFGVQASLNTVAQLGSVLPMAEFFRFSPRYRELSQPIYNQYYDTHEKIVNTLSESHVLGTGCRCCHTRYRECVPDNERDAALQDKEGVYVVRVEALTREQIQALFRKWREELHRYWAVWAVDLAKEEIKLGEEGEEGAEEGEEGLTGKAENKGPAGNLIK